MARQSDRDDLKREKRITVFGGTGFLGRRIVKQLLARGFTVRSVSRHKPARQDLMRGAEAAEALQVDILDPHSVAAAVEGANAVVNAVSLYVEHGEQTFERIHVAAAAGLAHRSRDAGVGRFVQISGIGADAKADAPYIRARGRGEAAVKTAFPGAFIVRPAVMTGPDDAFLTRIITLIRRLPIYPLFGDGGTRLQPVYVEDVAEAVSRLIAGHHPTGASLFEFGGPHVYTYKDLVREIARQLDVRVRMMPVPLAVWSALAGIAERLPVTPITRNQIDLMRCDNVVALGMPGLQPIDIAPRGIGEVIRMIEQLPCKTRPG
jgi:uncharacterized protein YbjT (DUF2867 family)